MARRRAPVQTTDRKGEDNGTQTSGGGTRRRRNVRGPVDVFSTGDNPVVKVEKVGDVTTTHYADGSTSAVGLPIPQVDYVGPTERAEAAFAEQVRRMESRGRRSVKPEILPQGLDYAKAQSAKFTATVVPGSKSPEHPNGVLTNGLPAPTTRPMSADEATKAAVDRHGRMLSRRTSTRKGRGGTLLIRGEKTDSSALTELRYDPVAQCPGAQDPSKCAQRWHDHDGRLTPKAKETESETGRVGSVPTPLADAESVVRYEP